ncbi:MAG: hypothetical protein HKP10_02410, partial [Kiritimatiellales bacterium]|nr:hypothetical protein [Kiritimatiellales bacterium]
MDVSWAEVHTARSNYNWTAIDSLLQFADDQNQVFTVKIGTVGSSGVGKSHPPWMFSAGVPSFIENPDIGFTYGYYLDPEFKIYYEEMVRAFAKHLRQDVASNLQDRIAFIRVDTGATGDEEPYENGDNVPLQYKISAAEWLDYREWAFEVHRQAFQEGPGPVIPLLFVHVEPGQYDDEWDWINNNVTGGMGVKYDGSTRGHHLSFSGDTPKAYKAIAEDSDAKLFSRSEMDQSYSLPFWQLNVRLNYYWCALEQLNAGMSIWDVTENALEDMSAGGYEESFTLFNLWAAELVPATARGGFCVFHKGLDSSDASMFPLADYGGGDFNKTNTNRYEAICASNAVNGAQMDSPYFATLLQVAQRKRATASEVGFNDSGWGIHAGNYDRFITQINPETTSIGRWRVRGTLTPSSHPYDRFARGFGSASSMMYFDVNDRLTPNPGQRIELSVVYLDEGTGDFALKYDAVGDSQKTAFTVTKTNSNTWKTNSV